MELQLENKRAFISGSTSGIGFAIARNLLKEGANVVINGRTRDGVDGAVQELSSLNYTGTVSGIAADFSKPKEIEQLMQSLAEVDILVNNAGIFEPKPFFEITDEEWLHFFSVNVLSGVRLSRHFFPAMLRKNWGRIIFISSESAVFIPEEMIHYGVTKTAQLAVSRGLAELTKGTNVTVNAVLPGPTMSNGAESFLDQVGKQNNMTGEEVEKDFFKNARPTSLLQRFASTDEIAAMVTFLVSPLASATNGAAVRVDGGIVRSVI